MLLAKINIFLAILFSLVIATNAQAKVNTIKKDDTLASNYAALLNDMRWFFQRLEDFAVVAEKMLPNTTVSTTAKADTRTFSENTRINVLIGIKHLIAGIKEISMTFRQSFEMEQLRKLQHLKQATDMLHEVIKLLKQWFHNVRVLISHLFRLYNRHLPEVLLGKCLGSYVVAAYPDRAIYEYPFILLREVFDTILNSITITVLEENIENKSGEHAAIAPDEQNPIEQNEIPYLEQDDNFIRRVARLRVITDALNMNNTNQADSKNTLETSPSFFNLSDVLDDDKDSLINNAIKKQSWQMCFKMYTAESIVRQLKIYFLDME